MEQGIAGPAARLVVVPGHGVCRPGCCSPERAGRDESWIGVFAGEAGLHVKAIERGVRLAASDGGAVLVFSGGQTRAEAGPRSEAESYREVAEGHGWWGFEEVARRTVLEEHARDSFENVVFSLAAFFVARRRWPDRVTVVGWEFKEERFRFHAETMGWPVERFAYDGCISPPKRAAAVAGEKERTEEFRADPFGRGAKARARRAARDPFGRGGETWRGVEPEIDRLLAWVEGGGAKGGPPWVTDA